MRSFKIILPIVLGFTSNFISASGPKFYPPAHSIASLVPRGGASSISNKGTNKLSPAANPTILDGSAGRMEKEAKQISSSIRGGFKKLPSDNTGWKISFVLSIAYTILFFVLGRGGGGGDASSCSVQMDGFCVTNLADCKAGTADVGNSHLWAWQEDLVFTIITLFLPLIPSVNPTLGKWLGTAVIIFAHGYIHKFISDKNCNLGDSNVGLGTVFYLGLSFMISLFTLDGFGDLSGIVSHPRFVNFLISLGAAALTYFLTLQNPSTGVAAIFLVTQLLASGVAVLIPKEGSLTNLTGYLFVLPCAVSIIELLFCCINSEPSVFNKTLGHAWYDLFLHISVIGSLLPENFFKFMA